MKKWLLVFFTPLFLLGTEGILLDENFSPISGAHNLRFAHSSLCGLEDDFLAKDNKGRTLYAWGRFGELLIWKPINIMMAVTQHEVFGHGYRLRDCGVGPIEYGITPWGGYTSLPDKMDINEEELLAVAVAGLEAEGIFAHQMKMEWMKTGGIDGRASSLYTQVAQSLFWYTVITVLDRKSEDGPQDGNDIEMYLSGLNYSYPDHPTHLRDLMMLSLYNLLDPMTYFAEFSWYYYIATGEPWKFPMFTLSPRVRYLPNIRIGYAPYGPEVYWENYVSVNKQPLYIYIKGGERSSGVGFEYLHPFSRKGLMLGLRIDGWQQLKVDLIPSGTEEEPSYSEGESRELSGIAATLKCKMDVFRSMSLFAEIGGKTEGYLPGHSLKQATIVRFGLTLSEQ